MLYNTVKKAISRQPICLTDADHDYILEKIGRRDKIEGGVLACDFKDTIT